MRTSLFSRKKAALICALLAVATAYAAESPFKPGPGRYPRFDSKQAEPGLTYGKAQDLPLPKTVLYSVGADELLKDAEAWTAKGIGAFFITGVAPEWSADIWAADGEPWTIGASDASFQKVRQANELCKRLGADTFLTMSFSRHLEWFNNLAWPRILDNFRQFAVFARETGCTGVAIDIEYIGPQYHFSWEGYDYDGYTRKDLVETIRARMTRVASAIYDEFPDAVLLTFPESSFTLGAHVQSAWIEEAARRNAPGGVHLCTEYTYRRPNLRYMFAHAWLNNRLMQDRLGDTAKAYWREKCSIAEGLWPFGVDPDDYHGAAPSVEEFKQAFAASLMAGSRYNWIYSHDARPIMLGREPWKYGAPDNLKGYMDVLAAREIVTDPKYLSVAGELRRLELRDFSPDLGLALAAAFAGPREEVEVSLMPAPLLAQSDVAPIQDELWKTGLRLNNGEAVDMRKAYGTQTEWLILGPFDNAGKRGFDTAYPPEAEQAPAAEYDGVNGKVRWTEHREGPGRATVNLATLLQPAEEVCAYALCYVTSDRPRDLQVRAGANDAWKLWLGGRLVHENAEEGRVLLDRDVIPVSLPAGTTPILLKVCNNRKDWGFVFRITDTEGKPVEGLEYRLAP